MRNRGFFATYVSVLRRAWFLVAIGTLIALGVGAWMRLSAGMPWRVVVLFVALMFAAKMLGIAFAVPLVRKDK